MVPFYWQFISDPMYSDLYIQRCSALYSNFIYRGISSKLYSKSAHTSQYAYVHMHMQMSQTTATFLAKHELSSYSQLTAAFDEHGWDSLPALQETSPTMSPTMGPLKQLVMVACEGLPCPL